MFYCTQCGTIINDDAMFCENCGKPVEKIFDTGDNNSLNTLCNQPRNTAKASKKKIVILVSSVAGAFALVGIIIAILANRGLAGKNYVSLKNSNRRIEFVDSDDMIWYEHGVGSSCKYEVNGNTITVSGLGGLIVLTGKIYEDRIELDGTSYYER